jgi:hypothetical protein
LKGFEEMSISEPGHPLFLTEDSDDDPVAVSEIQIARVENGQQVFYPRLFPANELQSLEQVSAELGGGSYILIARHEGRITTRRKYVLPGKPKPMYDEGRQEGSTEKPVTTPSLTVPPVADPMMSMIMMMMQGMMQQQAQAQQSQTQMFIAMMQGNQQSTAEEKAAARAELQANIERERINSQQTLALMREMMTSRGGGSGEDFTRGVEFMRTFATQQIDLLKVQSKGEDTDWGSILETLGQAMQGLKLFQGVTGQGPLPEGVAPAVEAAQ